ncbi:hypothetical protein CISIN_1g002731mg [Citrus sinensis]|uniref:Bromo domain-containing protein n=3 Tax=Citrus sinensis TaxID=2711 RepID=A0A067FH32_CITSI|nr:hypothetical protein CISIN_1g002731mg [Citrus sinensis]
MGQIVKRKKKGRPSKADLARRPISPTPATESEVRRSLRRRNVRYDIDYYEDYFDEEDEDEEEERRREKKLKLVVKLNQRSDSTEPTRSHSRSSARAEHASDDEDEDEDDKPLKKRKINGGDFSESDDEEEENNYDEEEGRRRKVQSKGHDSPPGTPNDRQSGIPMPDKKSLELILDKLQKKDTYGVYAEPVDPEELPDYHDVIENPMDFTTVRKKLANGSYSSLDQFESDVFLICTNAMQYNAPDTVYHKQARAIQELAKKKFHRLRAGIERSEKELKPEKELNLEKELRLEKDLKSEPKTKSSILVKKQTKKHFSRTIQEPVGSDFSSGATLATTGDIQNGSVATQAGGCERPTNTDAIVDGNSSLADNNLEKVEELSSAKGLLSKLGRKPAVPDENRRATYSISTQPVVRSDSIFTTFEGETKHLVAVGLHAEYSYARSLARFAATLGPVAWKVASRRIEQALPAGCKFGRGWVGEYEPLPTPVLMLETCTQKESALFSKLQSTADVRKDDTAFRIPIPAKVHPVHRPISEGNSPLFRPANGLTPEGKTPHFSSAGKKPSTPVNAIKQKHNPFSRTSAEPENKVSKQVELNLPPSANQSKGDTVAGKQVSVKLETGVSRSTEMVPRNMHLLQSSPSKQQNGNVTSNSGNARVISPSSNNVPSQMAGAATFFPHGPEQGRSDSVHLMKTLNEKAQKQQNSSNQSAINTPPVMPSVPSVRRDDSGNAAAVAARAWMSIGAGGFKPPAENSTSPKNQISAESLYNPTREFHTQISRARGEFPLSVGMQFQTEKNSFPPQGFMPQPVRAVNEAHFQNRPMVFPQLLTNDFARFQMQSPWRGLSPHSQPRPRQEGLPPDLNISFQSPGSPVKQSTGVLVDSQQPDLALQL